jgi:hypothetical protein
MRQLLTVLLSALALIYGRAVASPDPKEAAWTIVIHPADFVIGPALKQLHTRHIWVATFDDRSGAFEIALRKTAVAIPAPRCRMDYLILEIPSYYPENPKQASVGERHAIYDDFVELQARGSGSISARVEAPGVLARNGTRGPELAACNLYFALPLSVQVWPR